MDEKAQKLKIAFQAQGIVPEILPDFPPSILDVTYQNNSINLGNILTPRIVKHQPNVVWPFEPKTFYTLCMIDPDAPSREEPKFREWVHWLIGNVLENDMTMADTLAEYIGAGPPKGTGYHRYIFLLFKQSKLLKFTEERLRNNSTKNRGGFAVKNFAEKYKLGSPIAANFFYAEFDDYVPILYKKLSCCN